jgi:hypothetical protein
MLHGYVLLRKLTEFCEFGLNLNDTLRDRFVCGLRNDQIQKKLLTIREFSLDKALEIAVAMETATKDAIELRNVQNVPQLQLALASNGL